VAPTVALMSEILAPPTARAAVLYHYCRLQLPAVVLPFPRFQAHLTRTFRIYAAKSSPDLTWSAYFDQLYAIDWYLACGCIENDNKAWEALFATRTGRSDCLLIDALRARAVRLYPRDEEKQEAAVAEFWSHLLVSESPGSVPVMARYDGQRPLAPWLIRVFQNWHVSRLRSHGPAQALPEDDIALPLPEKADGDGRWHDQFVAAAHDWLATLSEQETLLLGLRWRYRLSQRDISHLFGVHEGTISRQTDKLRDRCLDVIGKRLTADGWTGDDLEGFILTELGSLLMDDPKLSADQLTAMMARRGKSLEAVPR
jgi:RNA polymerase sigma factor (sigma-70 family)